MDGHWLLCHSLSNLLFSSFTAVHCATNARCFTCFNSTRLRKCNVGRHSSACNLLRILQPGWSLMFHAQGISAKHLLVHTGFGRLTDSKFSSNWRYWRCTASIAQLLAVSASIHHVADIPSRLCLRFSSTEALIVHLTCVVTVSDRAFLVVAIKLWNKFPSDVNASQPVLESVSAFRC